MVISRTIWLCINSSSWWLKWFKFHRQYTHNKNRKNICGQTERNNKRQVESSPLDNRNIEKNHFVHECDCATYKWFTLLRFVYVYVRRGWTRAHFLCLQQCTHTHKHTRASNQYTIYNNAFRIETERSQFDSMQFSVEMKTWAGYIDIKLVRDYRS